MDNFNHNIIEQLEAEVKNKHYHEELVLQGRMVGIRNESDKWCMRGHRTTQEAKTCNGTVKPVFELSDPPRLVPRSSGTKKASYRLRPRSETYLSYNIRKNNQKYVPIAPKPKPRSMGKVYHFKAANSNPRATVQMHPIPEAGVVHHERGCPLYRPSQPTIQVVGDGPV